jgi:hypothetical protein
MGVVFKAEDTRLGRFVALKFIADRTLKEPRELLAGAPDAFGLPAFSSDGRALYFRALRDEADIWMLTLP